MANDRIVQILNFDGSKIFATKGVVNLEYQSTFDRSVDISGGVQIDSWSVGGMSSSTQLAGGGGGAAKMSLQALQVDRPYDQGSPLLFNCMAAGKLLKQVTLVNTRPGAGGTQQIQSVFTFSNCYVISQQWSGSGDVPIESLQLNAGKMVVAYQPQGPNGMSLAVSQKGWDLIENKAI